MKPRLPTGQAYEVLSFLMTGLEYNSTRNPNTCVVAMSTNMQAKTISSRIPIVTASSMAITLALNAYSHHLQ